MTELTKLEVGKTYVFKDEESKALYMSSYTGNSIRYNRHYKDGFKIESISAVGCGWVDGSNVIDEHEMKLFKEKTMSIKPEDEVTITTTYGELARAYAVLGKVNGKTIGKEVLWCTIRKLLEDPFQEIYNKEITLDRSIEDLADYAAIQEDWLNSLFPPEPVETEQQKQIRELREQAEVLLDKANQLEGIPK